MDELTIWKDRANTDKITLSQDGTALTSEQMGSITKIELLYKGTYFSSEDYSDVFDLSTEAASGALLVKLGLLPLSAGADIVELIVYDDEHTDGIMWKQFKLLIKTDAEV